MSYSLRFTVQDQVVPLAWCVMEASNDAVCMQEALHGGPGSKQTKEGLLAYAASPLVGTHLEDQPPTT